MVRKIAVDWVLLLNARVFGLFAYISAAPGGFFVG